MLLVLDVGNTNMVLGVYDGDALIGNWRLETKKERTGDELGIFIHELLERSKISPEKITQIAVSSVVPSLTFSIDEMSERYFKLTAKHITGSTPSLLKIKIDRPEELGADRLVNAVAAYSEYKDECLIIDFGTATTFDVVNKNGEYLGGAICPGLNISAEALFTRASKLPRVEITAPNSAIGNNTVTAMQSGLYWGYVGLVEKLIDQIFLERGIKSKVIATGGLAKVIATGTKKIDVIDDWLTLKGLKILAE